MRKPPWLLWWEKSQLSRKPQSCGVEAVAQWSFFQNTIGKIAKFRHLSILCQLNGILMHFLEFLTAAKQNLLKFWEILWNFLWLQRWFCFWEIGMVSLILFSQICLFVIFSPHFLLAFLKNNYGYFSIFKFSFSNKQQIRWKKFGISGNKIHETI